MDVHETPTKLRTKLPPALTTAVTGEDTVFSTAASAFATVMALLAVATNET
jgi:hypothetical protein